VGLKYAKICVGSALTPLGSPLRSLRPLGWGGGHPSPNPTFSRCLRRLDSRAFASQFLWPPM